MAVLHLENGQTFTNLADIGRELSPLNIQLNRWVVGINPSLPPLLAKASLTDQEKETVLRSLDGYFNHLQQTADYQSRDLIVLHPEIPNLDDLLAKFERIHTHADAEVRYIIDGEGVFGFVCPDGSQMELLIQAEEYINVPPGTEHWFYLTPQRRIKAVRYFSGTEGWVPYYTNREIRLRQVVA